MSAPPRPPHRLNRTLGLPAFGRKCAHPLLEAHATSTRRETVLIGASIIGLSPLLGIVPSRAAVQPLISGEEKLASIYERERFGVVSIVDIKLRGQAGGGGSPDTPEGNGTGIVFDTEGNVVTHWHVLATSLKVRRLNAIFNPSR